MKNKHIIAIDFILVVGTLFLVASFVGYARPLVIAPEDNFVTADGSVLFSFGNADKILIDDNLEFSSPTTIYANDNLVINLKPGVYYWKIEGVISSDIRKITIKSQVDLKLRKSLEGYSVVNAGNTVLNVDVYDGDSLQDKITLGVDQSKEVSGTKFIGGQNE